MAKHQPAQRAPFSPEKYVKENVQRLPYYECWATFFDNEGDASTGLHQVCVAKLQPSGKICMGIFLIDTCCLGVKDANYRVNLMESEYREFLDQLYMTQQARLVDVHYVHNLIYGAHDYAEELGFKPHKDFRLAEYFLDSDLITDGIDEIEFGKNGKPFYVAGPYDNTGRIIATLNASVGVGNYHFIMPMGDGFL